MSIGEVSRRAGVAPSAIRYHERRGLLTRAAAVPFLVLMPTVAGETLVQGAPHVGLGA